MNTKTKSTQLSPAAASAQTDDACIDMAVALDAASKLRQAVEVLRDRKAQLERERDELTASIQALRTKPVSRADAKQFMLALVDQNANEFIEKSGWESVFERIARPRPKYAMSPPGGFAPLNMEMIEAALGSTSTNAAGLLGNANVDIFIGNPEGSPLGIWSASRICFFFGDQIKARIEQYFDLLYSGPPNQPIDTLEDRLSAIATMRARIVDINAALSETNGALRNLGI